MTSPDRIRQLVEDAEYLAHRYDEQADAFRFIHVPRDLHRSSTFITDEHLPNVDQFELVPRAELPDIEKEAASVHFIFHSAYCCSTMLTRAFDIPGVSMGLKEPVLLNDMIGWSRRGADKHQLLKVLDQSLNLLGRPLGEDHTVVIKPSNICTPLAIPILKMRPQASALLLYAPLDSFLKSIAKKEMWGRIWVRDVLIGVLKDGYAVGDFTIDRLLQLTDLQVAAIGWLSQHAVFNNIINVIGRDRVKTLDSDSFLADQSGAMRGLNRLFKLELDDADLAEILDGPAFNSHSKLKRGAGEPFDADKRALEQQKMLEIHGAEIDMVTKWTKVVAESHNIPLQLGCELIEPVGT